MASTTFTNGIVITADWLNDLNDFYYDLFAGATTAAAAATAIGLGTSDSPTFAGLTVSGPSAFGTSISSTTNFLTIAASGLSNTTERGILLSLTGSTSATTNLFAFTGAITQANGITTTNVIVFAAADAIAGSGSTITNLFGFSCSDLTPTTTLTAGFRGSVSSGTGKWNCYMQGTANNAFNGSVRIGSLVAPTETLHVTGTFATSGIGAVGTTTSSTTSLNLPASTTGVSSIRLAHGSAPSAPVNGDMWTTTAGLFVRINGSTVGPLS